ncbi:tyrosine-type recombinase/integrase [Streptomyces marispadix]|uniref:Site-specific integrase n=1 Tax=Streptomyces marispadix TaxID=2922868 RepID=A0ABS9SZ46_9ACTN|nr:site-specific integrase [Streptomyces marispadix]MCH6161554.1 site-specific integrase [Streptomyces marispadix]
MLTYDVDVWSIRNRKGRPKPFELRWRVGSRPHSRSFKLKAQADGRRSELMTALRNREQFDEETGLPASELANLNTPTWYEHATAYVLMKWPKAAAKHRAGIAEALAVVTPVFVSSSRGAPDPKVMRTALYAWAFRAVPGQDGKPATRADVETPPDAVADALAWVGKHSLKVTEAASPEKIRAALDALSVRLDGKPAAENTANRKRMVLSNALRYAVERDLLSSNPMARIDWTTPPKEDEVDFRYVPNPTQVAALLTAVREQGERGRHLAAFFGCLYYAAMRPSEIASLRKSDCHLPEKGWGELILAGSQPEVGSGWTDDGASFEQRGLKRRARRATRPVPIPPVLVGMLREHLGAYGVADDGRLFRAARGGRIRSTEYCEVWDTAREKALTPEEAASPLADVPYSLRHAGVSLWIKSGVDPVEVARRAYHSITVLFRFYAKILRGEQSRANELIEERLNGGA